MQNVAILIFDDVEVLDFAGPFEVFGVCRLDDDRHAFTVYTVAEHDRVVKARNGLMIQPNFAFANAPQPDILVVPGGQGTRPLVNHPPVIEWIRTQAEPADLTLSVCTGALLLGRAGLLDGLAATTYHTAFDLLGEITPTTTLRPGERWVDNGKIITSAGVSAGIDMALHVVRKLHGPAIADKTAQHMEYEHWAAVRDV